MHPSRLYVALKNVKFYKLRTILLLITVISMVVGITSLHSVVRSYRTTLDAVGLKIGADIILADEEANQEVVNELFKGNPGKKRFSYNDKIRTIEELDYIDKISKELLLSTLNSSCCEYQLQMIAVDYKDSFNISGWIQNDIDTIGNNEIVVGNEVAYSVGEVARFFNRNFKVVGKLDKTDMGYDVSVFVNEETGGELVGKSEGQEYSMIIIKVVDGYDIDKAVRDINSILKGTGIKAYKTSSMFTSIKEQIELSQHLIRFMTAIISIIGVIAILTIFIMNTESRITEINVYKIMGISNKTIMFIIFLESFICVILGGILGSISSLTIGALLRYCIQDIIQIIYSVNILDIVSTSIHIVFVIIFACLISILISMGVVVKDKRVFR